MTNELDDIFATDKNAEEDGVWVELTPTIKLKIRAYGAKVVTDLRDKLMKPYTLLQRSGQKIPDATSERISLEVIAGAVIVDWTMPGAPQTDADGNPVLDADGNPVVTMLPYTPAAAYDTLKRLPRMANFVIGISTDAQFYKNEVTEDGAKNS